MYIQLFCLDNSFDEISIYLIYINTAIWFIILAMKKVKKIFFNLTLVSYLSMIAMMVFSFKYTVVDESTGEFIYGSPYNMISTLLLMLTALLLVITIILYVINLFLKKKVDDIRHDSVVESTREVEIRFFKDKSYLSGIITSIVINKKSLKFTFFHAIAFTLYGFLLLYIPTSTEKSSLFIPIFILAILFALYVLFFTFIYPLILIKKMDKMIKDDAIISRMILTIFDKDDKKIKLYTSQITLQKKFQKSLILVYQGFRYPIVIDLKKVEKRDLDLLLLGKEE